MSKRYTYSLSTRYLHPNAGSKAANIHFLLRHHCQVPASWVIIWTAHEDYQQDSAAILMALRSELAAIIDPGKRYAVRSSASVEDTGDSSCAGLFNSYLEIQGVDAVIDRISKVWASLDSPEFRAYRDNNLQPETAAHMAVIIQEMVQAQVSGVVFSKNPMTGLSETIIEAGQGTGEFQAEDHRDPERWISKWGNWLQKPQEGVLSEALAREIVVQTNVVSRCYRRPADLEWAWDGEKLFFLQIRPITRLEIPIYSNRIAKEMLPGIIKPLVWSVNTRLINPTWVKILTRLTGDRTWNPESLTGHYYFRAYFNMAIFARVFERLGMPGEALELLLGLEQDGPDKPHMRPGPGIIARLPHLLAFAFSLAGINGRLNRLIRTKTAAYAKLVTQMAAEHDPSEWLQLAAQIFDETKEVAYFNIMVPMLAMMHHRMLISMLKKQGYDARLLELSGAKEAAGRYNPQNVLQVLHDRYYRAAEKSQQNANGLSPEQEQQLRDDIEQFLVRFGHFSDSGNDCSSIPWRETPDLIRRMVARPSQAVKNEQSILKFEDLKLKGLQRLMLGIIYRRTSRFAVSREKISSLYTYGYGQFRTCFVRLGEQLASQGVFAGQEDIFYLYWSELSDIVANNRTVSQQSLVNSRREAIESYRDAILPETIFGSEQPPLATATQGALRGIPTSLGTYTGPVRVVQGINDFEKLQVGDVLVIPFSDVGWTPLFARAGAVVAESGGMLSHSSIVAREYRIPAVVSAAGACRLADGIQVTVNGYTGEIVLL
jgi:phosphohistidine swiveling domain-containing protein